MDKGIIIALILGALIIGGAIILTGSDIASPTDDVTKTERPEPKDGENVSIVDGVQIVTIDAKGGYLPKRSVAKAGIPTVVRFNTKGTFDCSASVRIPSLDISEFLPASGEKDIDLGTPAAGPLQGSCGMGMYPFEIEFK